MTRILLNGEEIEVEEGRDLLSICLEHAAPVPHFCWHGALGSIGACRMCAVRTFSGPDDQDGRLEMACMTPAREDLSVVTEAPDAKEFRARISEWLMVNHPHDCAVCERGGNCHLQDMTVASGHSRRRYAYRKRTHRNQYLGPLLKHEMNRCIACYRCTRFYRDHAGGHDLNVFGTHDRVYFGRSEDGALESPFAGNLAEVCPTGVFVDKAWSENYARPWDMRQTPSICPHCSVGCNLFLGERRGRLRRVENRYHGAVNGYFLCDRGRYGPHGVMSPERLARPLASGVETDEDEVRSILEKALAEGAVGLGSPRASVESNFALQRLVGQERFFSGVTADAALVSKRIVETVTAGERPAAALADIENADAVLVLGEDVPGTAPRLALALLQASKSAARALADGKGVPSWSTRLAGAAGEEARSPVMFAGARGTFPDGMLTASYPVEPGGVADFGFQVADALGTDGPGGAPADVAASLRRAERPLVISGASLGDPRLVDAARAIADMLGDRAKLTLVPAEANSLGLGLLQSRRETDGIEAATAALESGAARNLIVLESDLYERVAPQDADALLAAAETVIVLDHVQSWLTGRASAALPVASFAEAAGTFVNHEGRAQRFFAALPDGAPAAWRRLSRFSRDTEWHRLDDLLATLAAERPELAAIRDAAPGKDAEAGLGGPVPRGSRRLSGRTADDLAGRVPAGMPQDDPDSPLGWSMEGPWPVDIPPALITRYETAGFHAADAVFAYQSRIAGSLRGGDPGALVRSGPAGTSRTDFPSSEGHRSGGLRPVVLGDPFRGDEAARTSPYLRQRMDEVLVVLHPADAASLGLAEGDRVRIAGREVVVPLALDDAMPRGCVGGPRGLMPLGARGAVKVEPA